MRHLYNLVFTIFCVGILFINPISARGQNIPGSNERWDLLMIKEAHIWNNLLTNYAYSDHKRYWPERKKALLKVINEFPGSQWADDAALILACSKASFENNTLGAIADLKKVIENYPDEQTIVVDWSPHDGCIFDDTWLMWQGGLVFFNQDGTVRTTKNFNRDGNISPLEKEVLAYFNHLERYPRLTKVTAQLFISKILSYKGDKTGSINALKNITSESANYLPLISNTDRIAASKPYGYYIRQLAERPEFKAYLSLIVHLEEQTKINEAVEIADTLFRISSKKGWLWQVNQQLGDFYSRQDLSKKANEQYQLSIDGLNIFKQDMNQRKEHVKGSDVPEEFWETKQLELEKRLIKN